MLRLSAILAVSIVCLLSSACSDKVAEHYKTYDDAISAGAAARGWLPSFVPRTAREIDLIHDLDTNHQWFHFKADMASLSSMSLAMKEISLSEIKRKKIVKPKGIKWPAELDDFMFVTPRATFRVFNAVTSTGSLCVAIDSSAGDVFGWTCSYGAEINSSSHTERENTMSTEAQFWWNWWISVAAAFGTVAAVIVALFGQAFRTKFFPPKLALTLVAPEGEKARVRLVWLEQGVSKERWEDARYYHLKVSNQRRWSPANNVQVFLMRLEEPGPDGDLQIKWTGDVPMRWRHQEVFPPARPIGPAADCDLCSVVKGKWLELLPLITPFNLDVKRGDKCLVVLSLQARGNEADSSILRVQVSWDGKWDDGAQEMKQHLIVKVLGDAEA